MGSIRRTPRHKADDKPVVFKTKMSKQQIVDTLFGPLDQPKSLGNEWCPLSEARLLQLVLKYRPIGINKHIDMDLIVMYMKHIYAKEDGVNIFLNDADLQEYAAGLGLPPDERVGRFEPSYSIRPTAEQIWEKISAWYDTNSLEFKEMIALPLPPELTAVSEFELPKSYFTDIQVADDPFYFETKN
nr:CT20 domain containing protein [Haemonchus contortus]